MVIFHSFCVSLPEGNLQPGLSKFSSHFSVTGFLGIQPWPATARVDRVDPLAARLGVGNGWFLWKMLVGDLK